MSLTMDQHRTMKRIADAAERIAAALEAANKPKWPNGWLPGTHVETVDHEAHGFIVDYDNQADWFVVDLEDLGQAYFRPAALTKVAE